MVIYLMMIKMREQEHPLVRTVRAYGQSGSSLPVPSKTLHSLLGLSFFNFFVFYNFLIHNFDFFIWLTRSPDYWYIVIFSFLKRFNLLVFYLDFNPFTLIVIFSSFTHLQLVMIFLLIFFFIITTTHYLLLSPYFFFSFLFLFFFY